MLTLTSLTIWLRWEQAGSGGSVFAGRGETGFPGSKSVVVNLPTLVWVILAWLVVMDPALLFGVKLASLVALELDSLEVCWKGGCGIAGSRECGFGMNWQ